MRCLLPIVLGGEVEAVVVLVRRTSTRSTRSARSSSPSTLADQAATALALVRARAEAGTDPVTGCMNHRAMRRRLHEEIGRAMRTGGPLSCLLIDLDDFKLVNDRHGHQAGDTLLREVCQALVGEVRAFDRVARYGGDEFVVILPERRSRQRRRRRLARAPAAARAALARGRPRRGRVDRRRPVADADEHRCAAARCDAALLRSKRQGKGRVTARLPAS